MASWGNQTGQQFDQDMDSSDGNNARKLRVRNNVAAPAQTHRVEIAERAYPLQPHNALKINGDTQIDYYDTDNQDHRAGSITPEPNGLSINAQQLNEAPPDGDPNLSLGWFDAQQNLGNRVYVQAKQVMIGRGANPSDETTPVFMDSPVKVTSAVGTARVEVDGDIYAHKLNRAALDTGTLEIGRENTTQIDIGEAGVPTHVYGSCRVDEVAEFHGDVELWAGLHGQGGIDMNGTVHGTALTGGSLSVNANADVFGDLTVRGAATIDGPVIVGTLQQHSDLDVNGNVNVNGDLTAGGDVIATGLDVNGNGDVSGTLKAHGDAEFFTAVKVTGKTKHSDTVSMNGSAIILGGEGTAHETRIVHAHNRIEFLVGGTLRFYIDETGGHNA